MLFHFKNRIAALYFTCLVQVFMIGPNANCKFCQDLFQECRGAELADLLNLVSYCLHIVHRSFQKVAQILVGISAKHCKLCGNFS